MARLKKTKKERSQGVAVPNKTSCPRCGSRDNLQVYYHEAEDEYSAYCWGSTCPEPNFVHWDFENDDVGASKPVKEKKAGVKMSLPSLEQVRDDFIPYDNKERFIREQYYEHFGCKMELEADGETIKAIYYPTYRGDNHVGYRRRSRHTSETTNKPEMVGVLKNFQGNIGDCKVGINMFGQHLANPNSAKRLIIVCGEEDAICSRMMLEGKVKERISNYDIVSCPSGENVKWIKPHLQWIGKYQEIYLMMDADEAGEAFKEQLVQVLPLGKIHVMRLPRGYKDPCDLWKAKAKTANGRQEAQNIFYKTIFDADKYSPVGVKSLSDGWDSYRNREARELIPWPASFGDLNTLTHGGYGTSEITTIAAASSVGKSSFVKEMINTAWEETNLNIGIVSLEETLDEFIEGLLSVRMSVQLNEIPDDQRDWETERKFFDDLTGSSSEEGSERIHFVDHQGGCNTWEEMKSKIDFLIKGLDCRMIVFDPATLAISTMQDVDEDEVMSDIVKIVKGQNIAWLNVLHVRKSNSGGTANSEGGDIAEEDIKGSGVFFQTSMNNLMLTRNKVHDNVIIRNTTKLKLTKCRRHGKNTGIAGYTYYNGDNGRLELGVSPSELEESDGMYEEEY